MIQIYRNCLYNKIWSDSSEDLRKELDGDIFSVSTKALKGG